MGTSPMTLARFEDEEVLSEDFNEKVKEVVTVMTPFVHM